MTPNQNDSENSLQDLKDYVSRLLAVDGEPRDRDLLLTIKRRLLQFGLLDFLSVEDVLHESFIRTQRAIVQRGTDIENIPAWLNRVSLNVIREQSRKVRANQRVCQRIGTDSETAGYFVESETFIERHSQYLEQLSSVLNSLSDREQNILELRLVKKYSWKEISDWLSQSESKPVTEAAARKRGERVLKKLKYVFSKGAVDKL
ncbi:MAG: sigma-70 family RNA polymerase sigma factor [Cyanobacteria bacterium P01_A01_bin.135]